MIINGLKKHTPCDLTFPRRCFSSAQAPRTPKVLRDCGLTLLRAKPSRRERTAPGTRAALTPGAPQGRRAGAAGSRRRGRGERRGGRVPSAEQTRGEGRGKGDGAAGVRGREKTASAQRRDAKSSLHRRLLRVQGTLFREGNWGQRVARRRPPPRSVRRRTPGEGWGRPRFSLRQGSCRWGAQRGACRGAEDRGPQHSARLQPPGPARPLKLRLLSAPSLKRGASEQGVQREAVRSAYRVWGTLLPEPLGVRECSAGRGAVWQWVGGAKGGAEARGIGQREARGGTAVGGAKGLGGAKGAVGKGWGRARGGARSGGEGGTRHSISTVVTHAIWCISA